MPKSKEYVSTDSDSSSEQEQQAKKKRKTEKEKKPASTKPEKKESKNDEESIWDLGNNRQVNVREFKGKLFVDIREMYFDKEGDLKPGKKGICLTIPQWRKLVSVIEEVDEAIKTKC